jgi:uncharacterized protein (TIGR02271 family)
MAQTVVGMFDNSSEAQQAVQKLVSAGISRDQIDISNNTNNSGSSYSSGSESSDDDQESGVSKFFKNLFGSDDDDADKYSHVARRAECIVTVHTQSKDESERVADILDDNGAVNVDERASEYGYSGSNRGSGLGGSSNSFGDRSNTVGAFDTGTSAGLTGAGSSVGDFTNMPSTTDGGSTSNFADTTSGSTSAGLGGTASTAGDFTNTPGTFADRSTSDFADTTSDRSTTDFTNTTSDRSTTGITGNNSASTDETSKIPIIEENLEVGKREVQSGGVRLRSRIIERPVEESVRLREERVNVERNRVDRPATEADFQNFGEKDIEMIERTEVPVVSKQARVVEEVSLDKDVTERNETISDTVRKTEVDVTDLDKDTLRDRTSNNDL